MRFFRWLGASWVLSLVLTFLAFGGSLDAVTLIASLIVMFPILGIGWFTYRLVTVSYKIGRDLRDSLDMTLASQLRTARGANGAFWLLAAWAVVDAELHFVGGFPHDTSSLAGFVMAIPISIICWIVEKLILRILRGIFCQREPEDDGFIQASPRPAQEKGRELSPARQWPAIMRGDGCTAVSQMANPPQRKEV